MKNEMEIKTDVYLLLKDSYLVNEISGVLTKTKRPEDSKAEDVIISVLTPPMNRQVQEVYVNVNIYVADVMRGNRYEENTIRLNELCNLAFDALNLYNGNGFRLTLAEQKVMEVQGSDEHFINNRVLYQFCNE